VCSDTSFFARHENVPHHTYRKPGQCHEVLGHRRQPLFTPSEYQNPPNCSNLPCATPFSGRKSRKTYASYQAALSITVFLRLLRLSELSTTLKSTMTLARIVSDTTTTTTTTAAGVSENWDRDRQRRTRRDGAACACLLLPLATLVVLIAFAWQLQVYHGTGVKTPPFEGRKVCRARNIEEGA
jgi:hypothetical protein